MHHDDEYEVQEVTVLNNHQLSLALGIDESEVDKYIQEHMGDFLQMSEYENVVPSSWAPQIAPRLLTPPSDLEPSSQPPLDPSISFVEVTSDHPFYNMATIDWSDQHSPDITVFVDPYIDISDINMNVLQQLHASKAPRVAIYKLFKYSLTLSQQPSCTYYVPPSPYEGDSVIHHDLSPYPYANRVPIPLCSHPSRANVSGDYLAYSSCMTGHYSACNFSDFHPWTTIATTDQETGSIALQSGFISTNVKAYRVTQHDTVIIGSPISFQDDMAAFDDYYLPYLSSIGIDSAAVEKLQGFNHSYESMV